jgi:hypothetical protein
MWRELCQVPVSSAYGVDDSCAFELDHFFEQFEYN